MKKILALLLVAGTSAPLTAQDLKGQEIIVTGSRIDQVDYSDWMPAVGLRQKADFLIQEVTIRGDSREDERREAEIRAMLKRAIELADRSGVVLAQGEYIVTQLTVANSAELELQDDRRPDSEKIEFLIKAPLAGATVEQAQARIRSFVKAVPEVGRAQMEETGDPTLSVVDPDSYRDRIIATIAEDAQRQAAALGDSYAVELTGLNRPVQWSRSGPAEVLLFVPYELKVLPKP